MNINWVSNETSENDTSANSTVFLPGYDGCVVGDVWYIAIPLVLICLCTIAVLINVRILVATRWLRRPISTTLFISLSLAAADSLMAALMAIGLLVNSLLPRGLCIEVAGPCSILALEALRLSCILVTMYHLLAQACNHYLGILAPFKSRRWLTHNNVTLIVLTIWILPIIFIFAYFSSTDGQGFQAKCEFTKTIEFIKKQRFRGVYSTLIFIPLFLMFFIYCHISVIVRRHQASRRRYTRHGRDQDQNNDQQFDRNLKAIWTTLLILSSYIICLMPAVMSFALICDDCYIAGALIDAVSLFILGTVNNFLLVIKPLLNPLIYASRMQEIRAAMRRMNDSCRRNLYPFVSATDGDLVFGSEMPRGSSIVSRTSTRRHHYSLTSTHQIGNGFSSRSMRRRTDDLATDL